MNRTRLQALLEDISRQRLLVIGDYFLDLYLEIDRRLAETSLETGLEAHQVVARRPSPGAAGNVAANARALGARVVALGAIGEDGNGDDLLRALQALGVDTRGLLRSGELVTPTYCKPLVTEPDGRVHELSRLDIKNRHTLPDHVEAEIIMRLRELAAQVDGIIVNDQVPEPEQGAITSGVRAALSALAAAQPEMVITVDSRQRIGLFKQMTCKPNEHEALAALGWADTDDLGCVASAGQALARRAERTVFCTVGARGCLVCSAEGCERVPAVPVTGEIDIVGAGDTTLAAITAALCAGASPAEAALIGNLGASVTIRCLGTTGTASAAQIMAAYDAWNATV